MSFSKPFYVGSVKSLYDTGENEITFNFSDRYSVFDWGEMPDLIPDKGKSLSELAIFFFEFLDNYENWATWDCLYAFTDSQKALLSEFATKGINHHYLGKSNVVEDGLRVKKVTVPTVEIAKGEYEYSFYENKPNLALVPLEVIFRHGVPAGSSLVKRDTSVSYGDKFNKPYIEFSTKLENKDRYLSLDEAKAMAGMSNDEWQNLFDIVTIYSLRLKDLFAQFDIELWDGKFEFAFGENRELMLVDSIGPDELRLVKNDISLSKEFLREFYMSPSTICGRHATRMFTPGPL